MMSIQDKITHLMAINKMSQQKLADKIGVSQGSINHYLTGRREIPLQKLEQICQTFGVNISYLYGESNITPASITPTTDRIPQYNVSACCGTGVENWNTAVTDYWQIPAEALPKSDNLCIIKATGDSMQPTINDGDYIIIDKSITAITDEGIYLININGNLMIKRIRINYITNSIDVCSDNPRYSSISNVNNDGSTISVAGKVLRKITITSP